MPRPLPAVALLLVLAGGAGAFPGLPVPDLDVRLPSIQDLLTDDDAPLTTTLDQATLQMPWLDGWNPPGLVSGRDLKLDDEGRYILPEHGGAWHFQFEGYCLMPGGHGPSGGGDGFGYAVWQGPRADIITTILRRSTEFPDLPRHSIQSLIWCILARCPLSEGSDDNRATAARLLSRNQRRQLDRGGWNGLPPELLNRFMAELPEPLVPLYRAEADLRGALGARTPPAFEELERIAVLTGELPEAEGPQVPAGRWNLTPDGQYVRMLSSGYSEVNLDLYVPMPCTIERDDLGRITKIADALGRSIETTYDDAAGPLSLPDAPGLVAWRFATLTFRRADGTAHTEPNAGWTFVEQGSGRPGALGEPLAGWAERVAAATARRERGGLIREHYQRGRKNRRGGGAHPIDRLTDIGHYEDGVKAATSPRIADRIEWISEHGNIVATAWDWANGELAGGGDQADPDEDDERDDDRPSRPNRSRFSPSRGGAIPSHPSLQRLGVGGRQY